MKHYRADGVVTVHSGMLLLTVGQALRRVVQVTPDKVKDQDIPVAELRAGLLEVPDDMPPEALEAFRVRAGCKVQFKAGEEFGYSGTFPSSMAVTLLDDDGEDDEAPAETEVPEEEQERVEAIEKVFSEMEEADPNKENGDAWIASGAPDVATLNELLGEDFDPPVSADERNARWKAYTDAKEQQG